MNQIELLCKHCRYSWFLTKKKRRKFTKFYADIVTDHEYRWKNENRARNFIQSLWVLRI